MNEYGRYKFADANGNQKGLENVDDIQIAIQIAIDFQCEVIDTKTPYGSQIVYSVWDGWNLDYDFYNEEKMNRIMKIYSG